jgi:sugar phosphate permease
VEKALESAIARGALTIGRAKAGAEVYRVYRYRWAVLAVYMFASALTQLFWLNFSAIDTYIEQNLQISAMATGMLTLVFPIVYIILSIPSGILIDKKGYKFAVGIGTLLTGIFGAIRLISPQSYAVLLISQIGIAAGQPFVINGITKLVVNWFPRKEEATAVGLGSLAMFIGMIISLGATPMLLQSLGFNAMLAVYSVTGVIGTAMFFLFAREKPPMPPRDIETNNMSVRQGLLKILKIKNFVILGFVALVGIGVFNGLATWLEKIMGEYQRIPMVNAGSISALMVLSGMIGCVVIPAISDKLKRRKPFLILGSLAGTICVAVLMIRGNFISNTINAMALGFFLLSAFPIILTMSIEITGEEFAGISAAYVQLLGNGAAIAIVPLIELLRNISGGYLMPLGFTAALIFIAMLTAMQLKESAKA